MTNPIPSTGGPTNVFFDKMSVERAIANIEELAAFEKGDRPVTNYTELSIVKYKNSSWGQWIGSFFTETCDADIVDATYARIFTFIESPEDKRHLLYRIHNAFFKSLEHLKVFGDLLTHKKSKSAEKIQAIYEISAYKGSLFTEQLRQARPLFEDELIRAAARRKNRPFVEPTSRLLDPNELQKNIAKSQKRRAEGSFRMAPDKRPCERKSSYSERLFAKIKASSAARQQESQELLKASSVRIKDVGKRESIVDFKAFMMERRYSMREDSEDS